MNNIILYCIIYILIAGYSYIVFKRICNNGWGEHPIGQSIFWPVIWVTLIIIAIVEGFKVLLNQKL